MAGRGGDVRSGGAGVEGREGEEGKVEVADDEFGGKTCGRAEAAGEAAGGIGESEGDVWEKPVSGGGSWREMGS